MSNMSYVRHENTSHDLADVWERWEDDDPDDLNEYEQAGRERIVRLVHEMALDMSYNGDFERYELPPLMEQ